MSLPKRTAVLIATGTFLFALSACSVSVNDKGEKDRVDIRTPVGGVHIGSDVDVKDTGLSVYPGSQRKPDEKDKDSNNANVTIASSLFGIKVAAVTYDTDAPPDKVIAYYKNELVKYGKVLQCRGKYLNITMHNSRNEESRELTCDKEDSDGNVIELKAGTSDNQHLVSVKPQDKGSEFSLVYVQAHGKREPI